MAKIKWERLKRPGRDYNEISPDQYLSWAGQWEKDIQKRIGLARFRKKVRLARLRRIGKERKIKKEISQPTSSPILPPKRGTP